jgi:hypothetical protein
MSARARLALACTLVGLAWLPAVASAASKVNVTIQNKSDWAIHELYLSAVDEDKWGPDQLGKQTIESGESFLLENVPCNSYDIKLVDEAADECVIQGVEICDEHQTWVINSEDLAVCEGYDR